MSDYITSFDTDRRMIRSCRRAVNTSSMSEWLGYASSGQRQWKYRDRARNWQATPAQSQQPTDRKVADFVDGLKRTTVLPSWMHSAEVDWNASNQRRQRHRQQHVSVDCRNIHSVAKNLGSWVICHIFAKLWPAFKILLIDSGKILSPIRCGGKFG